MIALASSAHLSVLNEDGVDVVALAREIDDWLARDPSRTAAQLAQHAGINPRGIWQLRRGKRPLCSLDWADRLTLAMDVPLNVVAPMRDDGTPIVAAPGSARSSTRTCAASAPKICSSPTSCIGAAYRSTGSHARGSNRGGSRTSRQRLRPRRCGRCSRHAAGCVATAWRWCASRQRSTGARGALKPEPTEPTTLPTAASSASATATCATFAVPPPTPVVSRASAGHSPTASTVTPTTPNEPQSASGTASRHGLPRGHGCCAGATAHHSSTRQSPSMVDLRCVERRGSARRYSARCWATRMSSRSTRRRGASWNPDCVCLPAGARP